MLISLLSKRVTTAIGAPVSEVLGSLSLVAAGLMTAFLLLLMCSGLL